MEKLSNIDTNIDYNPLSLSQTTLQSDDGSINIHAAIGLLINATNEIFIAERCDRQSGSSKASSNCLWEFPGGKIKPTETSYDALCRELQEEIGIQVLGAIPFLQIHQEKNIHQQSLLLDIWNIQSWKGIPQGCEGQATRWIPIDHLNHYTFPKTNKKLITELLQLLNKKANDLETHLT